MKKILIYDDEETFKAILEASVREVTALEDDFEIESMSEEKFKVSLERLKERRIALRERGVWNDEGIELDKIDVFIIDYDLVGKDPFLTGEEVAYLARCFSKCRLIVGVNQFRRNDFDLTLKGHPESFADLNVNVTDRNSQLSNPNLWGEHVEGFHPGHWPALPRYRRDFEKRVEDVEENLGIPIWQVLGFPREQFEVLPRSIVQFLGDAPDETTFRDFVTKSGNGLRSKDAKLEDRIAGDVIARVGAARISKWLERLVLPSQTILMDAPHLVSQYPSLLDGDVTDINTWNATARRTNYDALGLKVKLIEQYRLEKEYWLSRPVWFWDELRRCEDILEVREPWETERPDWVFCEDASRFYEEGCREFVADTEPPFSRRFVKYFNDIKYGPTVRFYV